MKRSAAFWLISALLVNAAALAGTGPRWAADARDAAQSEPHPPRDNQTAESRGNRNSNAEPADRREATPHRSAGGSGRGGGYRPVPPTIHGEARDSTAAEQSVRPPAGAPSDRPVWRGNQQPDQERNGDDRHLGRPQGDETAIGTGRDGDRGDDATNREDRGEQRERGNPRPGGRDDMSRDRNPGSTPGSRRDVPPAPVIDERNDGRDRGEPREVRDPRTMPGSRREVPPAPVVDPRSDGRDRGERRGFNDPRPNVNSDPARQDGNRNQPGDRHWSNDRDSRHGDWPHDRNWHHDRDDWDHDRDDRDWDRNHWHDGRGRDWHHERGWYDHYRYDHFRYFDGWFFARHRFFIGNYLWPYGYAPHRWHRGEWLPFGYYDSQYALDNYWSYDLYDPPYGCRWIRVGSDALLVDIDTGEILDTIYDLYW